MNIMDRRRMDELGRVVIPKTIRESANVKAGDELDVTFDGEKITISKKYDTYLAECIRYIKEVDCIGSNITLDEYDKLLELMDKLAK